MNLTASVATAETARDQIHANRQDAADQAAEERYQQRMDDICLSGKHGDQGLLDSVIDEGAELNELLVLANRMSGKSRYNQLPLDDCELGRRFRAMAFHHADSECLAAMEGES